ncbi:bifunctional diaminohydroxyphosphoribosylaminopyrimidine deaminase/5-amino-6-(5-phosphoribosylamino)uracil reductase RibD [Cohnella fermenti]|uniref:Riboflavin biosynthesis protein RibD n=1 Tax=Cohnella fermenti TaxID=2565925 RepID=A0A4S4BTS1_9BACL|nr:bifunctional diaminohydroxyphosphoribosylaminopyrimidine deaminase/5-amino-6-(5-phosphoribosylamino)uracil reductase RibD [Cohnella fermenti]
MKLALQAASAASGQTSINPVVGCVVVNEGRVVGIGAHLKRGEGHAEVHALNMAGDQAKGATAYVTLEPCSHHGRTPPCCERLIEEGVKRVVVAATDPNPLVAGRGIKRLEEAGIEVRVGLLEEESRKLNEVFNKYILTKLPFVTVKTAVTLDGRVATRTGHSRWVTGPEAREAVHTLRHRHAAIMVGVGTILADDSELTTRLSVPGIHPIRIVVDSSLRTPPEARVLNGEAPTVLLTTERAPEERIRTLEAQGAEVLVCGPGPRVDLKLALRKLGEKEISSILVEGGGALNGSLLEAGLVDKLMLFYAPKLVGSEGPPVFAMQGPKEMGEALELTDVAIESYGRDWCVTGYPSNRAKPEPEPEQEGG